MNLESSILTYPDHRFVETAWQGEFKGKSVGCATEALTGEEIAAAFARVLGKPV